jgi:uncharacterized protein (TIGR03437 family)
VQAGKITAIAPYEISGKASTTIGVRYNGRTSAGIMQQVAATAPGIFTVDGSQAAALNQNGSYNGPACPAGQTCSTEPAPIGTIVSIFGTGEGLVSPLPPTGSITASTAPYPAIVAPVVVKVDGVPLDAADVLYAGPAPALAAGVIQINFRIPSWASVGRDPVQVKIGDRDSNTVAVAVAP